MSKDPEMSTQQNTRSRTLVAQLASALASSSKVTASAWPPLEARIKAVIPF
jgi:hypothetical protein